MIATLTPMSSWDIARMNDLQNTDGLNEWQKRELEELETLYQAWEESEA